MEDENDFVHCQMLFFKGRVQLPYVALKAEMLKLNM